MIMPPSDRHRTCGILDHKMGCKCDLSTPPITARERATKVCDTWDLNKKPGYDFESLISGIEQALLEFAAQEVEKAMKFAEDVMQNHIGYAGDYDAGATQTAKNIAFLIRKLWVELRNDSQGRKA